MTAMLMRHQIPDNGALSEDTCLFSCRQTRGAGNLPVDEAAFQYSEIKAARAGKRKEQHAVRFRYQRVANANVVISTGIRSTNIVSAIVARTVTGRACITDWETAVRRAASVGDI